MTKKDIEHAILDRIAAEDGFERSTMYIGENDAVLYRREDELLAWGQTGSSSWLRIEAELNAGIAAAHIINHAARK